MNLTVYVHDSKSMKEIPYEPGSHYLFDRAYNNFKMLYKIHQIGAYFEIRTKANLQYKNHQMETQIAWECAFRSDDRIDWVLP